jgi:hypothetical protein
VAARVRVGLGLIALAGCGGSPAPPAAAPPAVAAAPEAPPPEPEAPPAPPPRPPCTDLVACTNGCAEHVTDDCATLGVMYLDGKVVTVDLDRADDLLQAACRDGSARACLRLAEALHAEVFRGHPGRLKANPHFEELNLLLAGCEAGANEGCLRAGRSLVEAHGTPADPARAAKLFDRACSHGNAAACFELGRLFARGEGVEHRPDRAGQLFLKACQLGNDEGCLRAAKNGAELSPRE